MYTFFFSSGLSNPWLVLSGYLLIRLMVVPWKMKPDVKKRVRLYGIPIDLVILATGVAMFSPAISSTALIVIYLFAVILSALKLGWRSGMTAMLCALGVMLFGFGARVSGRADAAFVLVSLIAIAAGEIRRTSGVAAREPALSLPMESTVATSVSDEERERFRLEKEALERRLEEERREAEERMAREREALPQRLEENRLVVDREAAERAEGLAALRLEAERQELERKLGGERTAAEREAAERQELERKIEEGRLAALEREKDELARRIVEESEQAKREAEHALEQRLAAERAKLQKQDEEHLRAEREALEKAKAAAKPVAPPSPARVVPERGIFSTLTSWLKTPQQSRPVVNLKTKKISGNATALKQPAPAPAKHPRPQLQPRQRRPRILMLERWRGIADAVAPKLRDLGVDVQIVERWIDVGHELVRFRPDAIFLDAELPTFHKVHKVVVEQAPRLPIFVTAGSHGALPNVPRAASVIRPYNAEAVAKLARESMTIPQMFLERQRPQRGAPNSTTPPMALREVPIPLSPVDSAAPKTAESTATSQSDRYEVKCSNCRVAFDATEAVSCNCLTNERTFVCTNCLTCFCKSSPSYKEKFWLEAPARLFERKSADFRKQQGSVPPNPGPEEVRRPLVMLVEDDEDIQTIVQRVCSNLGYGFVSATNGEEGLNLARLYKPNLILSDAFMPKLDGREMCRILKEQSVIPDCKMVVMTGLYTDTKYKNEALKRFHIDDYLSKPVSIADLINLLQKLLEGDSSAPPQEDLHELHRKEVEESADEFDSERGIALAEVREAPEPCLPIAAPMARAQLKTYEVCCFACGKMFNAAAAEWCMCLGRDETLLCPHCNKCFCKAPAAYKERFWMDAPSTLFERKMIGSKRSLSGKTNPSPKEVKRPLILLVEDDENIQLIVKTVVTTMGYGFILAADGQEGLAVARHYNPDLILSDAFMPKLDGREMCRLLKEDPSTARAKAIIMTGLYTDRKYRTEALTYFKVDDYVAKPVAVDDLIRLIKKHLPQEVQLAM